jgi:hypothetical protein
VGLLSLMVTWWFHPIDRVNANQFVATVFEVRQRLRLAARRIHRHCGRLRRRRNAGAHWMAPHPQDHRRPHNTAEPATARLTEGALLMT